MSGNEYEETHKPIVSNETFKNARLPKLLVSFYVTMCLLSGVNLLSAHGGSSLPWETKFFEPRSKSLYAYFGVLPTQNSSMGCNRHWL
jgi:hypothetical protein